MVPIINRINYCSFVPWAAFWRERARAGGRAQGPETIYHTVGASRREWHARRLHPQLGNGDSKEECSCLTHLRDFTLTRTKLSDSGLGAK